MSIEPGQKRRWLYELELNGFILFKSFLPPALIEALGRQIDPFLAAEIRRLAKGDRTGTRGTNRISIDLEPWARRLGGPLDDPLFRRNPVVEEIVDAVLIRWRYGVTKAECPLPGSEYMTWHPDTVLADLESPLRPERLTFNVSLSEIDASAAPMEVVPGSHRMLHKDAKTIYELSEIRTVKVLMSPGDCMLRDGNMLHRGTPNLSSWPRILLDQTYRALKPTRPLDRGAPSRIGDPGSQGAR